MPVHALHHGDVLLGLLGVLGVLHGVLLAVVSALLPHWVPDAPGELLLGLPEPPVLLQWWWW